MYSVLSALSEYTYMFTYQKILIHTLFCLILKSPKAFNIFLMQKYQNGQTHFKNLAAFASVSEYFGTLCINPIWGRERMDLIRKCIFKPFLG